MNTQIIAIANQKGGVGYEKVSLLCKVETHTLLII